MGVVHCYNVDFHFLPEGGHEGNQLGAAYTTLEEGKWDYTQLTLNNDPDYPIYEMYMEVPYTIECFFYLNGALLNYPAKKICGWSDVINLGENPAFDQRKDNSKVLL